MKYKRYAVLFSAIFGLFAFAGCGGEGKNPNPSPSPGDPPSAFTVTVSGKTVDKNGALAGVTVTAADSKGGEYGSVTTAEDGRFSFDEVSKTRGITLTFAKSGYFTREIELSISDIAAGKNAMGDVELEAPSERRALTGKVVAKDGKTPVPGVTVKVKGFEDSASTAADGVFTLENAALSSSGTTLELTKFAYKTQETAIAAADIGADGSVGDLEYCNYIAPINGAPGAEFSFVRGETRLKLYMDLTDAIAGGENIQVHMHIGDNVDGRVYGVLLLRDDSDSNPFGKDHVMFSRKVSGLDQGTSWEDAEVTDSYTISEDGKRIEYAIDYASLGMEKDDTIGIAIMNVVFDGAGVWTYPSFGQNLLQNGLNVFDYTMFYDFDAAYDYSPRDASLAKITGRVTDGAEPLSGAAISVIGGDGKEYPGVASGSDGGFTVEGVSRLYPAEMRVTKSGYIYAKRDITLSDLQAKTLDCGDVALEKITATKTLTGTVTNLAGEKAGGVKVSVFGTEIAATTDASGGYTLPDVPIGSSDVLLIFEKTLYKTVQRAIPAKDVTENVGDTEIYSEFASPGQVIQFAIAREADGLRIVFRTPNRFETLEMLWLELQTGDEATGTIRCVALLPENTTQENAFGIMSKHPSFTSPAKTPGTWSPVFQGGDVYEITPYGENGCILNWSIRYSELGIAAGDSFGIAMAAALFEGNADFACKKASAPATNLVLYNEFYTYTADGSFVARQ